MHVQLRYVAGAFLLAASATAQDMTIQTSLPSDLGTSTSQCLEVCVVEPCSACSTTTEDQMSIPPGETPITTGITTGVTTPLTNPLTDPSIPPTIQTSTPEMSIPSGETPTEAPGTVTTPVIIITTPGPSPSNGTTPGSPSNTTTSLSTSAGPSQSTPGAAPSVLKGDGKTFVFAVALSALSVTFGFAWSLA